MSRRRAAVHERCQSGRCRHGDHAEWRLDREHQAARRRQRSFTRNIVLEGNGGIDVALHPLIWAGNISGAGQLIIGGSGVLTLRGPTPTAAAHWWIGESCRSPPMTSSVQRQGHHLSRRRPLASATSPPRGHRPCSERRHFQIDAGETLTLTGSLRGPGMLHQGRRPARSCSVAPTAYTGNINDNGGTIQGNTSTCAATLSSTPMRQPESPGRSLSTRPPTAPLPATSRASAA